MRILKFLLKKEFLQVLRNKSILPMIFVMPFMQLIVLPFAANYEMKNISLCIVDNDHSESSQRLINKFISSNYFLLAGTADTYKDALKLIEKDKADILIEIPRDFEQNLVRENASKIMIAANAINGQTAGLAASYAGNIIRDFNGDIRMRWMQGGRIDSSPVVEITTANWFNPLMNYKYFMVPGILAILVTMIGFFLTALNVVREKEIGTIEQINVSPISKTQFILGKLIPFWFLGLFVLTIGLFISWIVYGIVPVGNFVLIYAFAAVYLIAILGFGLLMSTFAETQQQAMFIAYFCITIFILLGGIFASIDNMPDWAQYITYFNPISYFIDVMRMIVLKGSGASDIIRHFVIIVGFAIVLNSLAVLNYHKTV